MKITQQPKFAGAGIRSLACLIDSIPCVVLLQVASAVLGRGSPASYVVGNLLIIFYYTISLSSPWQGTLGNYLLRTYVCTVEGGCLTVLHSFVRCVVLAVPVIPVMLVPLLYPDIEKLVQAFLSQDLFSIQQAMYDHADVVVAINNANFLMLILALIWFVPIRFSKQKAGIPDRICKTRVIYGRPGIGE